MGMVTRSRFVSESLQPVDNESMSDCQLNYCDKFLLIGMVIVLPQVQS